MIQKLRTATTPCTIVAGKQVVHIPPDVVDLESFRQWARSDEFPENGRICYLAGEVWVDLSMEQFFSHNQVKGAINDVLGPLIRMAKRGRYVPDGMRISNETANLSSEPDAAFVSTERFRDGRVRLVEGVREGYVELEGTPDLVVEIVSDSSETKDADRLHELYWQAGIPEYWLIDVRGERMEFNILRHGDRGYTATRKQGGWIKSKVLAKAFRLSRQVDELGHPEYTLEVS